MPRSHRAADRRSVPTGGAAALAVLTVLLAGCGAGPAEPVQPTREVTLVAEASTQGDLLTELYRLLLERAGYRTDVAEPVPRETYLEMLEDGRAQLAPDHVSALAEALRGEGATDTAPGAGPAVAVPAPDATEALAELEGLARERGLATLRPARAEDVRSFAVTRAYAARHRLRTLGDLARSGRPVALAADTECAARADCAPGLSEVYGIRLRRTVPTGVGGGDTLELLRAGTVQLAQVSSTDARLGEDVVVLADDRDLQPSQQVVPVAAAAWLADQPTVRTELARLADVLTTRELRGLIADVDTAGVPARDAARAWLEEQGLL